jgi:hypothetical protein
LQPQLSHAHVSQLQVSPLQSGHLQTSDPQAPVAADFAAQQILAESKEQQLASAFCEQQLVLAAFAQLH